MSSCSLPPGDVEVQGEVPSPDNEYKVVVYRYSGFGGALEPFYQRISIVKTGEHVGDGVGNVYSAEEGAETKKIWVNWLGKRRLQIFRDPKAEGFCNTDYYCFSGFMHRDDFKIDYADYPQTDASHSKSKSSPAKKRAVHKSANRKAAQ